jgi:chemotaxis protein methyltransferase CheR
MFDPSASGFGPMNDREFRMFSELLRSHCGLHFGADTRFLLERRIERRMRERAFTSYAAYHFALCKEPEATGELGELVDEVTTNETYFLRERRQLRALVEEIFPELMLQRRERGRGPITVWSAGCASGEEPYSIVILAREAGLDPEKDLRVYATDISRLMVQRARQGVYRESSFRETEEPLRERYFEERDGRWRVSDEIKKHVDFVQVNLMDRSKVALLGPMDVILCRNVVIYFDAECKRRTIETFEDKLRPGGHLLLGHSESLINLSTSLELRHLKSDLVYRRPLSGIAGNIWRDAAEEAVAEAEARSWR